MQTGFILTYDAEKDLEYVAHNVETLLCQLELRGWDYELDVRGNI